MVHRRRNRLSVAAGLACGGSHLHAPVALARLQDGLGIGRRAALERAVKRDGTMVRGASGQRRLNGAVPEIRQGRIALARLLGEVDLAGEQAPQTAGTRRARKAAETRWAAHHARRAGTHG